MFNRIFSALTRPCLAAAALGVVAAPAFGANSIPNSANPTVMVNTDKEPVAQGKFEPAWKSLEQYEAPDWFRDAKFGIWAHWGPQCQPENGDWYARGMYEEGGGTNKFHVEKYGHPSKFGFKDVINEWKAEKWDPEKLVKLYKRAGAKYFFAMGNHHDNLDMWDSKYHEWNSVRVGPKKDILGGWAKAAKDNGLMFGVSLHAAHALTWYEPARGADKKGPLTGVAYDGNLTKADGKGTWWEGLDPQVLYAQNGERSKGNNIHAMWNWGSGAALPSQEYADAFYNRTVDMINKYQPDLLYFDDTALPLWPASDAGLKIAAHFYNSNIQKNGGKLEAALFGKILDDEQRKSLIWDIERGAPNRIEPIAWQTDTCIGSWHYHKMDYDRNRYKSPKTVINMLADIVSKNGNLLLNVPVRGDGSIDDKEVAVIEGITAWMDVNSESIYATRPWKIFGEGPASEGAALNGQGFNEGKGKPFTAADVRFTTKGNVVYAIVLGLPKKPLAIASFGAEAKLLDRGVSTVELLGSKTKVEWSQANDALTVGAPAGGMPDMPVVYKFTLK